MADTKRVGFSDKFYANKVLVSLDNLRSSIKEFEAWSDGAITTADTAAWGGVSERFRPSDAKVISNERKKTILLYSLIEAYAKLKATNQLPGDWPDESTVFSQFNSDYSRDHREEIEKFQQAIDRSAWLALSWMTDAKAKEEFYHKDFGHELQLDFLQEVANHFTSHPMLKQFGNLQLIAFEYELQRRKLSDWKKRNVVLKIEDLAKLVRLGKEFIEMSKIKIYHRYQYEGFRFYNERINNFASGNVAKLDQFKEETPPEIAEFPEISTFFDPDIIFKKVPRPDFSQPQPTVEGSEIGIQELAVRIATNLTNDQLITKGVGLFITIQFERALERANYAITKIDENGKLTEYNAKLVRNASKIDDTLLEGLGRSIEQQKFDALSPVDRANLKIKVTEIIKADKVRLTNLKKVAILDCILSTWDLFDKGKGNINSLLDGSFKMEDTIPTFRAISGLVFAEGVRRQKLGFPLDGKFKFLGKLNLAYDALMYFQEGLKAGREQQDRVKLGYYTMATASMVGFALTFECVAALSFAGPVGWFVAFLLIAGTAIVMFGKRSEIEIWFRYCLFGVSFDDYKNSYSPRMKNHNWYRKINYPSGWETSSRVIPEEEKYYLAHTWKHAFWNGSFGIDVLIPNFKTQMASFLSLMLPMPVSWVTRGGISEGVLSISIQGFEGALVSEDSTISVIAVKDVKEIQAGDTTSVKPLFSGPIKNAPAGGGVSFFSYRPTEPKWLNSWSMPLSKSVLDGYFIFIVEITPGEAFKQKIKPFFDTSVLPNFHNELVWRGRVLIEG